MKRLRVAIVGFDDIQALDVVGPLEVFARTTRWIEEHAPRSRSPLYDVELVGLKRGPIRASSGLTLIAAHALRDLRAPIDTVLVAGGRGAPDASRDRALLAQLRRLEGIARRFGSVCTGAFVLGAAGLLEGRRVTTHWGHVVELAEAHPEVIVDPDAIYVKDDHLYTSAGVTAGIDLALALVEEDHGRDVALNVARELVVFARRPGGQTQFSVQLAAQISEERRLRVVQKWMIDHPESDLSLEACAKRGGMSVRNFARVFVREVGKTPAAWVESLRVERARELLEDSDHGVEQIAGACGFGSQETMRRAFLRSVRVSPSAYRERFQTHRRKVS